MKFFKYNYILNELALLPSLQPSEGSKDEREDEGGATSPQQDSAGANSFSEDNQTREPSPTQEDEKPRMIMPITSIDCAMSALSITSPTPMFTCLATLTQPTQATTIAGLSQSGGGGGGGDRGRDGGGGASGSGSGGGTGATIGDAQPVAPPRNGLKGIMPIPFIGDKSLYNVFKTKWRMYKAIN
jgi:hypothetical protein